jgi:uracil-DNA glycosylase family 4
MNENTRIMVIGQNPGRDEVIKGEPFVGASGKVFDKMVAEETGMSRSDFYISNVLRCYTPGNRRPVERELEACRAILDEEIAIMQPILIIALGSVSFERLTGMHGIMKHHGEVVMSPRYRTSIIGILHPSPYNTLNPEKCETFRRGLAMVKKFLSNQRDS